MAKYDEVALYRGQAEQNTSGTEYGAYQLFQGQDQELCIVSAAWLTVILHTKPTLRSKALTGNE